MPSAKVEVTVNYEADRREKSGYRLTNIAVGDAPPIPIPDDVPCPRRLRRELVAAATGESPSKADDDNK